MDFQGRLFLRQKAEADGFISRIESVFGRHGPSEYMEGSSE
jgi:hypothetical protein